MQNKPLIAIVDDDESMRNSTKDLLESAGFLAATFQSAESFLKSRHLHRFACLVTDMLMPGMTGLELYRDLVASGNAIPTILITAYPDDRAQAGALKGGIACYLIKPFTADKLLGCIRRALDARKAGERRP